MNKAEALKYMGNGHKVKHESFTEDEYMTINPENGKILFEDGYQCSVDEFFNYRKDESFDEGYELFEDEFINPRKPSFLDFQHIYPFHMIDRDMYDTKDWGLTKKQREANILPIRTTPKIGRNEQCTCGSGKKNKHCCKQF